MRENNVRKSFKNRGNIQQPCKESPRITNWHQSSLPKYEEHEMG